MARHSSLFHKSAIALTTAAALFASPGFAQQLQPTPVASQSNQVDANTNCHDRITRSDIFGDAKCEIQKGKVLDAQGRAVDTQLSNEKDNLACMQRIKPFVATGKVTREMLIKFGQDRMCDLLKTLG
jgi:hypothetical protein